MMQLSAVVIIVFQRGLFFFKCNRAIAPRLWMDVAIVYVSSWFGSDRRQVQRLNLTWNQRTLCTSSNSTHLSGGVWGLTQFKASLKGSYEEPQLLPRLSWLHFSTSDQAAFFVRLVPSLTDGQVHTTSAGERQRRWKSCWHNLQMLLHTVRMRTVNNNNGFLV